MIPVGAIAAAIAAAAAAARAAQRQQNGQQASSGNEGIIGPWGLLVWFVFATFGLMCLALLLAGQVWALVPMIPLVVITFPWSISRAVLIPLGQARLAYWLTYTADFVFFRDHAGGAALAASWALAMGPTFDDETADWVAARLATQAPLRGAGVAAMGLWLAARGDRPGARALLATVSTIDDRVCPPEAKRLAAVWLQSDAAERGDWARVAELGASLASAGRLGWLLSGVAQALLLEPAAPSKPGLWFRWALAPHRRATQAMVERAVAAQEGAFIDPEDEPPLAPAAAVADGGADAVRTALSLHASVLSRPREALRADDLRAVGQAWDAAFDDRATEQLLHERALVLGGGAPAATLERVRAAVEDDLVAVILASGLSLSALGDKGAVTARVRARLRDQLLSEIEAASDAIRRRVDDKKALPAPDEWREWSNLTARYAHGVERAGVDYRRLAFAKVYPDACGLAVWLFNDRKQRPLGNVIFQWLLAEATALDDQRAVALQTKNVSCGV
jgi:hypothetical protein